MPPEDACEAMALDWEQEKNALDMQRAAARGRVELFIRAKDSGVKLKSPDHQTMIDEAMQTAATMDRAALTKARTIPAVVVHWNRLTGADAAL